MPRVLRSLLRDLRHTAMGGGPDDPPILASARPRWLRPGVRILMSAVAVLMALFALEVGWNHQLSTSQVVVWVLSAVPLLLVGHRPLLAWRMACVLALLGLTISTPDCIPSRWLYGTIAAYDLDWTIEWSCQASWFPGQVVVFAVVLFAVGTAQARGVLGWVWLATFLLAWGGRDAVSGVDAGVWLASDSDLMGVAVAVAGLLAGGFLIQLRSRARQRLVAAEERGTVLTERARIARELHDVVAHHMSMIAVRAETAPYRLGELPEGARVEFAEISQASREALTEMRRLLGVLRSDEPAPPTAPQPGLRNLPGLVESARNAGAEVTLNVDATLPDLPAGIDVSAYRILQEALTNAARHAPAAPIRVMVGRAAGGVSLSVRNGPPAAPAPAGAGPGHGIRGMRERAVMLGGELHADPTAEGGFEVSATLPLRGGE